MILLEDNRINTTLTSLLPTQLGNLPYLGYLYFGGRTELRTQYIHGTIPSYIGEFSSLRLFDLKWKYLTGTLPTKLSQNDWLVLQLNNNCLTGTVPSEIGLMTNLTYLELQGNDLIGSLPTEIFLVTNLRELGLPRTIHLPSNIYDLLPAETVLTLGGGSRCLAGDASIESSVILNYLGNQTGLRELDLRGQGITGTIPTEIGLQTDLFQLILPDNMITGQLPSELGLCTLLWRLEVSNCELSGTIPTEIGALSSLMLLDIRNNDMSGPLPSELGRLEELLILSAVGNRITGQIPSEVGLLTNTISLFLDDNELAGTLPSELGQLDKLYEMTLANNHGIIGSLPSELGLIKKGNRPDLVGRERFYRLNIANTSISGTVPIELARNSFEGGFKGLDATGTKMSGRLPEPLCFLENEDECFWVDGVTGEERACYLSFDCSDILCGCSCQCNSTIGWEEEEENDSSTSGAAALLGGLQIVIGGAPNVNASESTPQPDATNYEGVQIEFGE